MLCFLLSISTPQFILPTESVTNYNYYNGLGLVGLGLKHAVGCLPILITFEGNHSALEDIFYISVLDLLQSCTDRPRRRSALW